MPQSFWGLPIIIYLFFGGLSGGTAAACALDCLHSGAERARALKCGMWLSLASLLLGASFLFFDLGRPLAAVSPALLLHGSSWISRGVWIIALSVLADLLLILVISRGSSRVLARIFYRYPSYRDSIACALSVLVLACACALAAYTGFLLFDSLGVPFWNTPLLPVLFLFASLNVGASVFRVLASFEDSTWIPLRGYGFACLALELAFLVAFVLAAWLSDSVFARMAVQTMLSGDAALVFWLGVVGLGYGVTLVAKILPGSPLLCCLEAACSLVGMFCLRWCIVFSAYALP